MATASAKAFLFIDARLFLDGPVIRDLALDAAELAFAGVRLVAINLAAAPSAHIVGKVF